MKGRAWSTVLLCLLLSLHQVSVRAASVKLTKPLRALPSSEATPVSHPGEVQDMDLVSLHSDYSQGLKLMYVPRNLVLGDATMRNPVKYVMVETEEDPDTAPEGKQGQFIPSEDLERVFEKKDVQFIPSEDLKTTLESEEEHFIPSEDLKTTPEWKYEHLVPSDDLVGETHGELTPSAVKIKKNPVKYSTFLKIHKKGEKDTSEGKYEPVTLSGDQEGTGGPLIQSDVKVNKSPVKYSTFRTKDQEQDTPVRRADLTPSSTKVNKHMTRDRDSSKTTTTTKTKRPTKDRPGSSSSSTNSNPPELHYRKPGEAEDATGDHQLSQHVSGDSSLLTHLLTHLLQPSPHHHHHHHLLQPSASERSVWNKNSKNIHAGTYFKSLTNDGSFSSRQRRSVAIRRKREEVEWPVEVRVEEGGVRDVDVESGRQLVQNTVALITANPGLVLVFALSIWVVWAVAVGFDPIGYLNSFGTGAPGGGGSSGGSSVVSSSSSSAVVLGALDSPPALSLPAVQGADISPVLTDGEPSPGLDDAEPSPDAESVPTDDGGTPAAESGGPSLDGTTGDTSPVSDEGSAPPPSDADNPPSDPTSTDDATASDAAAPADDDTAPETPVSDGTDADSADSGDIDAESAASDDTAADSPASDDTAADSPASDDTAADSPASGDTAVDSPASDDTVVDSPASDDTAVDSPASGDTAVDSPASDDTAVDSPTSGDTAADSPASDDTAVDSPASGDTAGVIDGAGDGSAVDDGTGEDPLISEGAATGEDVGDSGAATGPGVLFAGAISDATTTEGEAGSLTPAFASLRPSSTTGTTEEALLAVDGAIWEILANISSSITTTESTDGENSPPKLPPLPVPTGDLTGPSITSSYSVLHACLVLGGDVPSCVAQAAAFGEILQNKTQDSLQRPTSDDVTPSSLGTILKIHPFAEVLHSLQDGDGGAQDAVIDKTPLGDLGDNNSVILGFLRNQNVSHDLVEKVISQVNSIKDTFKDSQVLIPWKENEGEVDIGEGSPTQDQEPSDNDLQENSEDLQESSGDLPENSDNLQENSGNLQENSDLPENSDDVEENHDTLPIMLDLQGNSEGPQRNSEPPKLYSTSETLALTDTGKNTPFSSLMLQGEISVKDKENEKTGDGDEKNVDNDNERKKINEAEKNKEEMKEEIEEEEIKKDKMGLTDRRGLLIKSKYPHAEILPTKPIRFYMRNR